MADEMEHDLGIRGVGSRIVSARLGAGTVISWSTMDHIVVLYDEDRTGWGRRQEYQLPDLAAKIQSGEIEVARR